MKQAVTLNDLPRYSPWPARLLGIDKWEQRKKNPEEVTREYEHEKWGPLFERVKQAGRDVTIDEVNDWQLGNLPDTVGAIGDTFEVLAAVDAYLRYLELVENTLMRYLPAPGLVELGAGYGSIILPLAKKQLFSGARILAGEYTTSGVELIKTLAKAEKIKVECGHCDFTSDTLTDLFIPEGAVIYTSYAIHYVPVLKNNFIDRLSRYKPSAVIHFEPCYEHNDPGTLIGLMRRRYVELNDYNTNLVSLLHQAQSEGKINIIEETPPMFGNNPFLPVSAIAWSPVKK